MTQTAAELAEAWNLEHPIGTPVVAYPAENRVTSARISTRTRSRAWVLGGHTAVAAVEGYPGGIALSHLDVLPEQASDREALGAALILLDRTEHALRATIAERDGWQRDAAEHAGRATATGYRLNGALRERDRLAVRLAEVERERDALESLHDEWAAAIREAQR